MSAIDTQKNLETMTEAFFVAVVLKDIERAPQYKTQACVLKIQVPRLIKTPSGDTSHITQSPHFNEIANSNRVEKIKLLTGRFPSDPAFIHITLKPLCPEPTTP
jgi:hypothetical protein